MRTSEQKKPGHRLLHIRQKKKGHTRRHGVIFSLLIRIVFLVGDTVGYLACCHRWQATLLLLPCAYLADGGQKREKHAVCIIWASRVFCVLQR